MKLYKNSLSLSGIAMLLMSLSTYAIAMENLNDADLQQVTGQAGADLSLKVQINHTNANVFDTTLCSDLRFCRLGISLNNRYDDGTQDTINPTTGVITPSPTGKKQWLVFKGIQGTINIPYIGLDGVDVTYASATHTAIKLSFDPNKPIQLQNVGFESLAIETDTVAAEGAGNVPGYLTPATLYGGTGFDSTKERGFMGLKATGNISLTGDIKIFSCGATHSRC